MAGIIWDEKPSDKAPAQQPGSQSAPPPGSVVWDPPTVMDRVRNAAGVVRDVATNAVAKAGQYTPVDTVQLGLSKLTGGYIPAPTPLVPDENAREYAKVVVPQTGTQLGTDVALGLFGGPLAKPIAKVATRVGPVAARVIPPVARIAAGTAGGAAGAALGGEDATQGAVLGGLGTTLGEGVGAARTLAPAAVRRVGKVAEKIGLKEPAAKLATREAKELGDVTTRMVRGTQASQEALRVGQEMGGLFQKAGIPGLSTTTQEELFQLARSGKGKEALDTMFDKAKDQITQRLKGRKLYIPEFGSESVTRPSVVLGPNGEPIAQRTMRKGLLTLDEALTELQNTGKGITQQTGLQRSVGSRQASLRYGEARDAVIKAVAAVDKQAAATLDKALTGYRQGRAYLNIVEKSLDNSGRLDPARLTANVNKASEKLQKAFGDRWKQAESALTGGRGVPVPVPPPYRAQPPVPQPRPLPQLRPGTQTAINIGMQAPQVMLPSLGAASMLAGPVLRNTPGLRHLHTDELLDTIAEGL